MSRGKRDASVVLVGPTAVGKTEVAISLARDLAGEIVNLDSRQLYRGMDIGTAKATPREQERARHHLVDVADPGQIVSLAEVLDMARAAVADVMRRGRLPILCGGTGQYVRALVEGWEVPSVAPDPRLRERLQAEADTAGAKALHERLAAIDPAAATRIHPHNVRRVIRALEVFEKTGMTISSLQSRRAPPVNLNVVGLRRPQGDLAARIEARVRGMISAGLEDEVRRLLDAGLTFDSPAMSGVGYAQWRGFFEGRLGVDEVEERIVAATRALVRKQGDWFRQNDPGIRWVDVEAGGYAAVLAVVSECLGPGSGAEGGTGTPTSSRA